MDHFHYVWVISNTYGSFSLRTGHFKYVRTISITYGTFPICTDHFHYVRVISNTYGSFPIYTGHFQYTHIIFNHLEYTQSISSTSNHFRTISFQKLPYASYLSPFDIIYPVQHNIYIPSNLCSHPKQSKP